MLAFQILHSKFQIAGASNGWNLVQARRVDRHRLEFRARGADVAGAGAHGGIDRHPAGDAAALGAVLGAAADPAQHLLHAGRHRLRTLLRDRVDDGGLEAGRGDLLRRLPEPRVPHVRLFRSRVPGAGSDSADDGRPSDGREPASRDGMTFTNERKSVLHSPKFRTFLVLLILLGAIGGVFAYYNFFRTLPAPYFEKDEDHFLFGSIGTEDPEGIPYWIWLVLPRIFPEHLPSPGGYASIGILSKDGREMPVGFSKVTVGFDRVGINCAMCHTASWRARAGD